MGDSQNLFATIVSPQLDFEIGCVTMWSGAIIDIPAGWYLCDGNNGTLNLTDKFIVPAGSTYNPNDTGGSETHTHEFTTSAYPHSMHPGTDALAEEQYADGFPEDPSEGTTDPQSSLPPYYSLAYIQFKGS